MSVTDTSGLMHLGWLRVSLRRKVEPLVPTQNQCGSEISDYKCTYYVPHPEISTKSTQKIRSWLQVSPRIHNTLHLPTKRRGAKPYEPWSMPRENSWGLHAWLHRYIQRQPSQQFETAVRVGKMDRNFNVTPEKGIKVVRWCCKNPYQAIQQSENRPFKKLAPQELPSKSRNNCMGSGQAIQDRVKTCTNRLIERWWRPNSYRAVISLEQHLQLNIHLITVRKYIPKVLH